MVMDVFDRMTISPASWSWNTDPKYVWKKAESDWLQSKWQDNWKVHLVNSIWAFHLKMLFFLPHKIFPEFKY